MMLMHILFLHALNKIMFTGIIQSIGEVIESTKKGVDLKITIKPGIIFENQEIGESIAINGCCLTVETFTKNTFTAFASKTTLENTNIQNLIKGSKVNLERALKLGQRLGGHIVTGHIDCIAQVIQIEQRGQSKYIKIQFPKIFSKEIVSKGSITLDGISLTVNDCGIGFLTVNIIPETQKQTIIYQWIGHI